MKKIIFLLMTFTGFPDNWNQLMKLFINGFLFKVLIALIDTPIIYLCVFILRSKFDLEIGEELT